MFGWFKKRVVRRMSALVSVSQMAVAMALMNHYDVDGAPSEGERNRRAARAAAGANYLFGKSPDPAHVQQFNLPEIHGQARAWLQDNEVFRELVVQSLRVATVTSVEVSGAVPIVGGDLLPALGGEFPDVPDPTKYEALLSRAIALLPPSYQQSIRGWMSRQ